MTGKESSHEWGTIIERYVSVYPAVNLCGVVAWYFKDGELASLAFASMPMSVVRSVLEAYEPDSLIVESYRAEEGHRAEPLFVSGVDSVWYVAPKWRKVYTKIPRALYEGSISPLAHRAFSIGWDALIKNADFKTKGKLPLNELTPTWLKKYGPWRPPKRV